MDLFVSAEVTGQEASDVAFRRIAFAVHGRVLRGEGHHGPATVVQDTHAQVSVVGKNISKLPSFTIRWTVNLEETVKFESLKADDTCHLHEKRR